MGTGSSAMNARRPRRSSGSTRRKASRTSGLWIFAAIAELLKSTASRCHGVMQLSIQIVSFHTLSGTYEFYQRRRKYCLPGQLWGRRWRDNAQGVLRSWSKFDIRHVWNNSTLRKRKEEENKNTCLKQLYANFDLKGNYECRKSWPGRNRTPPGTSACALGVKCSGAPACLLTPLDLLVIKDLLISSNISNMM